MLYGENTLPFSTSRTIETVQGWGFDWGERLVTQPATELMGAIDKGFGPRATSIFDLGADLNDGLSLIPKFALLSS